MTVIDRINSSFTELQDYMGAERIAIEEGLDRASAQKTRTQKQEFKILGEILELHKSAQAMLFLQQPTKLTIKDQTDAAAVVDFYLTRTQQHFQQLLKSNTMPDEIAKLNSSRQALKEWVKNAKAFLATEKTALVPTPTLLEFTGIIGGPNPVTQKIQFKNTGYEDITWHAEAATTSGGNWLIVSPTEGELEGNYPGYAKAAGEAESADPTSVTVAALLLQGLTAQQSPYKGTVTIYEIDGDGNEIPGSEVDVAVNFTVCTIASSPSTLSFDCEVSAKALTPQTVSISAVGSDGDTLNWIATPTVQWLTTTPSSGSVSSSTSAQVSIGVILQGLDAGTNTGAVLLMPADSHYNPIGSPQIIQVSLTVNAAPVLVVSPSSGLTFKDSTGISTQSITISNAGGEPMNWVASLDTNAPGFVSLSADPSIQIQGRTARGTTAGGKSSVINVNVNATGITDNETHKTKIAITATDASTKTGQAVAGSPVSVPITIQIASYGLFLCVLGLFYPPDSGGYDALVVRQTEKLFKREHLTLSDRQLDHLTRSWDRVIEFVANPPKFAHLSSTSTCLTDARIVDLFTVHGLLNLLYDRIRSDDVTRSDRDILDLE